MLCAVDGAGVLSAEEVGVELRTSGARSAITQPVITAVWNALPSSVVEASSLTVFKRLLGHIDLTRYCIDIR